MLHAQKKVVGIVAELSIYFLALGADRIDSSVINEGNCGKISFRANYNPNNEDQLQDLEKCLNQQKNDGIEEIYWELAGSGNFSGSDQLLLIGTMVDKAEVRFADGFVELTLYKEFG